MAPPSTQPFDLSELQIRVASKPSGPREIVWSGLTAPQPPQRSALSEPQNFIAEAPLRRLYRRHRWIVWSVFIIVAVGVGSALPIANYRDALVEHGVKNVSSILGVRLTAVGESVSREQDPVAEPKKLPAFAPAGAASKSAEAKKPEAPAKAETPKIADAPKPAAAPEPTETTASISTKPETISARDGTAHPAVAGPASENAIEKADRYLSRGQYAIARYLYEEAYQSGEILGALGLARSYDASYLRSIGLRAKGDAQKSRVWYRRAAELSGKQRRETP